MAYKFFGKTRPLGTLKYPTPASTLIGVGYPLKLASNALAIATVGAPVTHIAQGSKLSSDSATTPIEVIPIRQGVDVFVADVGTGTMASSYIGNTCDMKSGATHTIDLTADVKHDVTIVGWDGVDTTKAYVTFNATNKLMVP